MLLFLCVSGGDEGEAGGEGLAPVVPFRIFLWLFVIGGVIGGG